jgi:hypothetical protein
VRRAEADPREIADDGRTLAALCRPGCSRMTGTTGAASGAGRIGDSNLPSGCSEQRADRFLEEHLACALGTAVDELQGPREVLHGEANSHTA